MSPARRVVALVLLAGAVALAIVARPGGDDDAYRVEFVFHDAGGLRDGGDVKVRGVRAGRIEDVRLLPGDLALVSARLFEGVGPIGAGATGRSRPTGLLGETYVDVRPGDLSRPLPSGARVTVDRTSRSVTFAELVDLLDAPTTARLQLLVAEGGTALAGHGGDLHALLAQLPGSVAEVHGVVEQLRRRRLELRELVRRGGRVLLAVDGNRDDLGALVQETAGALQAVAGRREALGATVRRAPAALQELGRTVDALGATARELGPTSRQLVATAPGLRRVLAGLPRFRADVRGVLRTAREVAPRLTRFAVRARAPLADVQDIAEGLGRLAVTVRPIADVLGDGGTTRLFRFVDGFAQAMERRDGIGSLVRLRAVRAPRSPSSQPAARRRHGVVTRRPAPTPTPKPEPGPSRAPAVPAPKLELPEALRELPVVPQAQRTVDSLLDFLLAP